ncbi:MAG: DUF6527 family protein [Candidatus Ratteibacteria bacterium]
MKLFHKFVENIPDQIENGVIYISIDYSTAIHKCCCGCGNEVVTPFSPTDWKLIFDGKTISLYPSIGNWNFACQSHYWITNNEVKWTPRWTKRQIDSGRKKDKRNKKVYYGKKKQRSLFRFFSKK